jgi:dihydrofolate synthase/folylpolyglutamate synthase
VVDFVAQHFKQIQSLGLSFFEITAAMAFDYFASQDVEVAVIETGLGGRLDATNLITPLVSVITNIGLDHTDLLGSTLGAIAAEKAGIIKHGVPVVVGERDEECDEVFVAKANAESAPLYFAQQCFTLLGKATSGGKQCFELRRERDGAEFDVELDLLGEYQSHNVLTASTALDVLHCSSPLKISRQAYLEGFASAAATTRLVGR